MAAAVSAAGLLVFVVLAQAHVIFVPYFTPVTLQVEGLQTDYQVGQDVSFRVSVDGYGSNCHMLQVETLDNEGERISFYRRADDCRVMSISHGKYNLTRTFDYDGPTILANEGTYNLDVRFEDLIDGTKKSSTKSFSVNP